LAVDLVVVSLGGVQRLIAESRTTADVAGASDVVRRLMTEGVRAADEALSSVDSHALVFPSRAGANTAAGRGITNKIVFLAPHGAGADIARAVVGRMTQAWADRVVKVFGAAQETPGMPDASWVCVGGSADSDDEYRDLWTAAQGALVSRRRTRTFPALMWEQARLCAQAPHLPAGPLPKKFRAFEKNESLSAAGWVKRAAGRENGRSYQSTIALASAPFRRSLIAAVSGDESAATDLAEHVGLLDLVVDKLDKLDKLDKQANARAFHVDDERFEALAGRLGPWVYPDRWDHQTLIRDGYGDATLEDARAGARAVRAIRDVAAKRGVLLPTPYYAIIALDVDQLGKALATLTLDGHRDVSARLAELAGQQWANAEKPEFLAEPIYAGGDDFLAFCPVSTALALAASARELVRTELEHSPLRGPDGGAVTASGAVVFAHMSNPLREVLESVRTAIDDAKSLTGAGDVSRDALTIVVRRRGGQRSRTVQPWCVPVDDELKPLDGLLVAATPSDQPGELSAGLASRLERDGDSLAALAAAELRVPLRAEMRRMVADQHGSRQVADALYALGWSERGAGDTVRFAPLNAALVARFLAQECQ
jgi:CRISPR-associated protein Cmr2